MNPLKTINAWTERKPVLARNVTVIVCCFGAILCVAAIPSIGKPAATFAAGALLMGAGCAVFNRCENGKR